MIGFLKFFFPALFSLTFWRGAYYGYMVHTTENTPEATHWKAKLEHFLSD